MVGHYFRILGFVSILTVLASLIRGKGLNLSLGIILLFWIGGGLLEGRAWPRRIALGICSLYVVLSTSFLTYSQMSHLGWIGSWSGSRNTLLYGLTDCALTLLLFLPPLALLLWPSVIPPRSDVKSPGTGDPRHWSDHRVIAYALGALLLAAVSGGREFMTGTLSLSDSLSDGFRTPRGAWIGSVITTATTEEAGPGFVSSWVLGEPKGMRRCEDSRFLLVGTTTVRLPGIMPGHYVRFVEFPAEPESQPNIVLVRLDGEVIRLRRRVTLKILASVEAALTGAEDVAEIQRRIEQLLPPVNGQFPE